MGKKVLVNIKKLAIILAHDTRANTRMLVWACIVYFISLIAYLNLRYKHENVKLMHTHLHIHACKCSLIFACMCMHISTRVQTFVFAIQINVLACG